MHPSTIPHTCKRWDYTRVHMNYDDSVQRSVKPPATPACVCAMLLVRSSASLKMTASCIRAIGWLVVDSVILLASVAAEARMAKLCRSPERSDPRPGDPTKPDNVQESPQTWGMCTNVPANMPHHSQPQTWSHTSVIGLWACLSAQSICHTTTTHWNHTVDLDNRRQTW